MHKLQISRSGQCPSIKTSTMIDQLCWVCLIVHEIPETSTLLNAPAWQAPKVEYEVLLLQLADGVIVTQEEAQNGHVAQGVGRGVEVVRDWEVLSFVVNRAQMLYRMVSEPPLGLIDVEEATTGAADTIYYIDGCAGEPLSDMESLFSALNE
eukprot:g31059.t1